MVEKKRNQIKTVCLNKLKATEENHEKDNLIFYFIYNSDSKHEKIILNPLRKSSEEII